MLALSGAGPAAAADACEIPPRVTLDIGHTPAAGGATSARGKPEYQFNKRLAGELAAALRAGGADVTILNDAAADISLRARAAQIAALDRGIFLSIHHDSVQPVYLSKWTVDERERRYSDRFKGYSLFIATQTRAASESLKLASELGDRLQEGGFVRSLHHAEPIRGENRTLLDQARGIYRFDELAVLKRADVPAVLIEAGIIVNRDEEREMEDEAVRARLVAAIVRGVTAYCGEPAR